MKIKTFIFVLALFVVALFSSTEVYAQDPPCNNYRGANYAGQVKEYTIGYTYENMPPAVGVTVYAQMVYDPYTIYSATTDSEGYFGLDVYSWLDNTTYTYAKILPQCTWFDIWVSAYDADPNTLRVLTNGYGHPNYVEYTIDNIPE